MEGVEGTAKARLGGAPAEAVLVQSMDPTKTPTLPKRSL